MNYLAEPKSEADWQAECDARTLCEALEIKMDLGRLEKAKQAAKGMLSEKKEKLEMLETLTGEKDYKSNEEKVNLS